MKEPREHYPEFKVEFYELCDDGAERLIPGSGYTGSYEFCLRQGEEGLKDGATVRKWIGKESTATATSYRLWQAVR